MILYLILGIALVGAVVGGYVKIHGDGVDQGRAEVRNEWATKNRAAQATADRLMELRRIEIDRAAADLASANTSAADYYAQWQRALYANKKPLATCGPAGAGSGTIDPAKRGDLVLRLTYDFVRQWDGAWTSADGKPVFADIPEPAGASGETYTPAEVLANFGINAARCSDNARKHNKLIDVIEKLKAAR